ncbi:MAG TPA: hypothetical protein VE591_13865, partial [Candidatus Acidoferrum sp.]|nr:hypothetical protein [Candidatus Acidoferrum sp.]
VLAALLALSPFQVIYAQQAREYALWTLLVLTAVWLLLRALRHGTVFAWIAFGIGLAATLYTDLLALLMLPGLALIVAANAQRKRAALVAWSAATAGAVIAYVPWLIAVVRGAGLLTNNGYLGSALPPLLFGTKWLFNAAAVFADFEYRHIALAVALIPLTLIVAFCVARVARNRRVASVIAALFVPGLVLLASDVVHHESRSTAARYLVPVWIGIDLLVAYGLTALLSDRWIRHRAVGAAAFAYLAVIGAVSSALDVHGTWTWADTSAAPLAPIAAAIDGVWAPYLVVREDPQQWRFTVFQLVNVVRPDVRVRMLHPSADIGAPPADATMLLLDPTRSALDEVRAAGLRVVPLYLQPSDPPGSDVAAFRARARATRELGGFHGAGESLWAVEPVTKR